jgi:hypothetical protein
LSLINLQRQLTELRGKHFICSYPFIIKDATQAIDEQPDGREA